MAEYQIVYWRDIPAQVIVGSGGRRGQQVKKPLHERFEKAIDMAAMNGNAKDTDSYLLEWRKTKPMDCGGDNINLEQFLIDKINELEQQYPASRLAELIKNGGKEIGK